MLHDRFNPLISRTSLDHEMHVQTLRVVKIVLLGVGHSNKRKLTELRLVLFELRLSSENLR